MGSQKGTGTGSKTTRKKTGEALGYEEGNRTRKIERASERGEGGHRKGTVQEQEGGASGDEEERPRVRSTELEKGGSDGGQAASSNTRGVRGKRGCEKEGVYGNETVHDPAEDERGKEAAQNTGRGGAATGPYTRGAHTRVGKERGDGATQSDGGQAGVSSEWGVRGEGPTQRLGVWRQDGILPPLIGGGSKV